MKTLTKAEEEIMKAVWKLGSGMLMEIVDAMPAPRPHKNTVATILKTLTEKEFIRVEEVGRYHRYHPAVSKRTYSKDTLTHVASRYFEGSFSNIVSFLMDEKKLSVGELESLLKHVKKKK